jgi:hypothetical protein
MDAPILTPPHARERAVYLAVAQGYHLRAENAFSLDVKDEYVRLASNYEMLANGFGKLDKSG